MLVGLCFGLRGGLVLSRSFLVRPCRPFSFGHVSVWLFKQELRFILPAETSGDLLRRGAATSRRGKFFRLACLRSRLSPVFWLDRELVRVVGLSGYFILFLLFCCNNSIAHPNNFVKYFDI